MASFRYQVEVGDPQGARYQRLEVLVDSGASFTVLPGELLRSLGVAPLNAAPFVLPGGRRGQRSVGQTWLRAEGRANIVPVVFGEAGDEAVLGTRALQTLLLAADAAARRLRPLVSHLEHGPS